MRPYARTWGGFTFGTAVPIYTTRKSADGETFTYSISAWIPLLAMFLVAFNVILWGGIGIYEAFRVIV